MRYDVPVDEKTYRKVNLWAMFVYNVNIFAIIGFYIVYVQV